eukprot:416394_1
MANTGADDKKWPETWGEHHADYYQVTGGVVKSKNTSAGTVYGSTFAKEGIHEWVVKYENTEDSSDGWIGITTHSGLTTADPWSKIGFGFYHSTKKVELYSVYSTAKEEKKITNGFNDGDTIRIVLNFDKKTVSFFDKNDAEIWTSKPDIPTGQDNIYRLCVSNKTIGAKYTITQYFDNNKPSLNMVSKALKLVNQ